MIPLPIAEIPQIVAARRTARWGPDPADATCVSVMTDSRIAPDGPAVFFALRTERADGHDHVDAASRSGAIAAVVERDVPDASVPQIVVDDSWVALGRLGRHVVDRVGCRVVAITGSFGKTTVKDLSAAALSARRRVTASRGSFNNELGVPLTMLAVEATTEVLVAEAGARRAGDIRALGDLLMPDVAVVTSVGPVHLETFGDEEGVAREKSQLVAALRPGGLAVLNVDDVRVAAMASTAATVLTVSAHGAAADLRAMDVRVDRDGRAEADVRTPWGDTSILLPMPGVHHVTNALIALAVASHEGVPLDESARSITSARTSPSRSSLQRAAGVTLLDDAYNASPPTMIGALGTLATLPCEGRRWAVLGLMAEIGEDSERHHVEVGRSCVGPVDELIVVGEAAEGIAIGATVGAGAPRIRTVPDQATAARLVMEEARSGDVVLFKASRVVALDRAAEAVIAHLREVEAG